MALPHGLVPERRAILVLIPPKWPGSPCPSSLPRPPRPALHHPERLPPFATAGSFHLFVFREREGREKDMERNISVREKHGSVASCMRPATGDQTCSPHMCPDQELNWRPFTLQDDAQPTEPHWSGCDTFWKEAAPTQSLRRQRASDCSGSWPGREQP